jgi:hypothetical protein
MALQNIIEFVEIASAGNTTDFGDLAATTMRLAGTSSPTRGIIGGGLTPSATNVISYITIATAGNATDFGDLTLARGNLTATSNQIRGVFGGGPNSL